MAYHHRQLSQSDHLRGQHGGSAPARPPATAPSQRPLSFHHGDEVLYPDGVNGLLEEQIGYSLGNNTGVRRGDQSMQAQRPPLPPPSASHSVGDSGEIFQEYESPAAPIPRPSYNPQQYGVSQSQSQSQYSPQPHQNLFNSFSAAYQPYVPAAYQSTGPPYGSGYGAQLHGTSPKAYPPTMPAHSAVQPPPLPPRPHEQRYGNRISPHISTELRTSRSNSSSEALYNQATLPSLPNSQSTSTGQSYTPPAPPPPPFTSNQYSYTVNSLSSAASQSYSHRAPTAQNPQQRSSDPLNAVQNQLSALPVYSPNGSTGFPSPAIHRRPVGSNSSLPQTPGTPGPTPPAHSPRRFDSTSRHPQSRPLPGTPSESASDTDYFGVRNGSIRVEESSDEEPGYDDLMQEVEAAVMGRAPPSRPTSSARPSPRVARRPAHASIDENEATPPFFGDVPQLEYAPDERHSHTNGHIDEIAEGHYINYDAYSDRSDAEAEAGLAAMHMAEEQDAADEARRHSGGHQNRISYESQQNSRLHQQLGDPSSDSDVHIDMDTYGGGFSAHVHYGDRDSSQPGNYGFTNEVDDQGRRFAETRSSQRSDMSGKISDKHGGLYDYPIPGQEYIHPFAPARVDRAGTGGLSEPGILPRRLSFEDGDETTLAESDEADTSATQSPSRDNMPEMFFHPGVGPSRPLPAAPIDSLGNKTLPQLVPAGTYRHTDRERLLQYDQYGRPTFPVAPDSYNQTLTPSGAVVPRSSSLISHSSTPQTVPPIRSKTDADRAKRSASIYGSEALGEASVNPSAELLGLPEIPAGKRRKFNPSKLSTTDFKNCTEPWALSSIVAWLKEMSEGEADLKENAIADGIVALFTHKVPTMNIADAETLGAKVVQLMFDSGTLLKEEEWVKFGSDTMSGVLFQLTGTGCYSPRVHSHPETGRCYSYHCMRTLKKINLQAQILEPQRKVEDWATFYKFGKSDIEGFDKKEVERQNVLHEIVTTEDTFMDQLNVLRVLYRDELSKWQPPIIEPKRKEGFLRDVFGKADSIKQVNEDHLLAQLKYRQQEEGPWVSGYSDIFREWIRKAKNAYIEYAASFPNATFLVRQEAQRNLVFRQFLDQMRENERSKRLGWDTYLKAPVTRLQRYSLLLSVVHKNMIQESEEKKNLQIAIEEIRVVTLECDARVADMSKHVDLSELQSKLKLRPGMDKVQLNLTHLGREIIFQGELQRMGSNKFSWVETHAILFDHYLVLAKILSARDATGGVKYERYDVSKMPIPMDLLVLESVNDDPVVKSTMKGIGSVTTVTSKASAPQDPRPSRPSISNPSGGPGTLAHTDTASSIASVKTNGSSKTLVTTTVLDSPKDEKVMFPFRVKHLGKADIFTLYAPTANNRQDWCDKIVEAKTRHASSLYKQNAEPFRLRVIADTAFGYTEMSGTGRSIAIKGTPLDRAIREVEEKFADSGPRPGPVCRAAVNCATAFNQPYGNPMVAAGTDYGVYISNYDNPRGWTRVISANRVTQIAVLEEFSLFILISDKSLIAYHLDSVCPVTNAPKQNNTSESSSRRAPQKLSGTRDVGFFAHGRMKDRTLVFYKKREGISSTFKVLEPVYQKSSTGGNTRNRFGIKKGTTEFFRDFDDFYIPSETYAINLFHSSLAISTARGIEVMTLDKKVPFSIPDLKPPDCASIAARIRDQKPLGMFRLSDSEFLLAFEEVGIYVNKHGDVSRAVVLEFIGRARQAVLYAGTYLILIDYYGGFIEVRNAFNGRLRQVVSGRDVRLLDDGAADVGKGGFGKGTVKVCMQHPEWERCQVVFEMIVNEGLKE